MGWVTLTQRKAELKQQHIYYQNRDLQISREKRQMARAKMFEESTINAAQKNEINTRKSEYYALKNQLEAQKTALKEYLAIAQKIQAGEITSDIIEGADQNGNREIYITGDYDATNSNAVLINGQPAYIYQKNSILDIAIYKAKEDGTAEYVSLSNNAIPVNPDDVYGFRPLVPGDIKEDSAEATVSLTNNLDCTIDPGKFTISYAQRLELPASYSTLPSLSTISTGGDITALETEIDNALSDIAFDLDQATLDYTEDTNDIKTIYETDLQMLEEDSADEELTLDQEQMEVETLMENISNELQSISDAASQQIQSSTIKLA